MDYRLECEARLADHNRTVAAVELTGWRKPERSRRYRLTIAQLLIALATRIAPEMTLPRLNTRILIR